MPPLDGAARQPKSHRSALTAHSGHAALSSSVRIVGGRTEATMPSTKNPAKSGKTVKKEPTEPKAKKAAAKRTTAVTPAEMPPKGTVAAALSEIGGPTDDEDVAEYTARLASDSHNSQVASNLHRIKLGMTLAAVQPKAREGRTEWQDAEAKRLAIQPRQLRKILAVANALRLLASKVPIAILDRPLAKVAAAAKSMEAGNDPDAEPMKTTKPRKSAVQVVDAAIKKLEECINGVPEDERAQLIDEIELLLAVLRQTTGTTPMPMAS